MTRVLVALGLWLSACATAPAPAPTEPSPTGAASATNPRVDPWPSGTTRTFTARWTRAGTGWIYDATLILRNDGGRVSGQILWTLVAVDYAEAAYLASRVGASASEFVTGIFSPPEGRLDISGTGVSDASLISTDTYRLVIGPDGSVSGRTITNSMDWSGTLVGRAR